MFALAEDPGSWEAPTGAGHWQVRDVFGHLIDTTETYFIGFERRAATVRGRRSVPLTEMAVHVDRGAQAFRSLEREEALERLHVAWTRCWGSRRPVRGGLGGLLVPHKYMGPLPAFFYPVFQLVDYAVHSWDIREGSGKPHALEGRAADLWSAVLRAVDGHREGRAGHRSRWSWGSASSPVRTPGTPTSPSRPDGLTTSAGQHRRRAHRDRLRPAASC